MQSTKQAIFSIGEEEYGLDIMDVNIIEKFTPVEKIANSPKNIKGILNLRGEKIPVYSLRRKFGLDDIEPNADIRLIITTSNGIVMAYEVDGMKEIVQLTTEEINEVPSILQSKETSYIKSVTNINGRLILLLDHDGILTEEEQNGIKAILTKLS